MPSKKTFSQTNFDFNKLDKSKIYAAGPKADGKINDLYSWLLKK